MPCPPSYEEQQMMQIDRNVRNLKESTRIINAETLETLELVQKTLDLMGDKLANELQRRLEGIISNHRHFEGPDEVNKYGYSPGYWPDMSDVQIAQQQAFLLEKLHEMRETGLCHMRTILMKIWFEYPQIRESDLKDEFLREKDAHLKHRNEDRDAQISRLEQDRRALQQKLDANPGHKRYQQFLKEKDIQIANLKSIPDEELLQSRMLW